MAKRNTKQGMMQQKPAQPKRRTPAGKSPSKPARASSSPGAGARSYNRSTQSAPRDLAGANLLTVRIAAIVIAVASVVGGVAWALSLEGNFGAPQVIGLLALAFLAGLGLAVAARTEQIVTQVTKIIRERR